MIEENSSQIGSDQKYVDHTDWYSMKAIFNDAGLYIQLKIFELQTDLCHKYSKHYVEENMKKQLPTDYFKSAEQLFLQVFKANKYFISPDGYIQIDKSVVLNSGRQVIIKLDTQNINQQFKLKQVIKKLKIENKRQKKQIDKLKGKIGTQQSSAITLKSSSLSQIFKPNKSEIKQKILKFQQTDSLKLITILNNHQLCNYSGRTVIIAPRLYVSEIKPETLDFAILQKPSQLVIGVMRYFDLAQNKLVKEDGENNPSYFVAFSSKTIRTNKKKYTYSRYQFKQYQSIMMKVLPEKVYFGTSTANMIDFNNHKDDRPFIQLGPNCKIAFKSHSLGEITK